MNKYGPLGLLWACILMLQACTAAPEKAAQTSQEQSEATERCEFSALSRVIWSQGNPHARGGGILQLWETRNVKALWREPRLPGPLQEVLRQRLAASGVDARPEALLGKSASPESKVVLQEGKTWLGPISCLESLLVAQQNSRMSLLEHPAEFLGLVFRSPDGEQLRVYFYSRNENGIGNAKRLLPLVSENWDVGWSLLGTLHYRGFHFTDGNELDGAPAPLRQDMQLNRLLAEDYQLQETWVTNGLSTARIPAAAFARFR